MHLKLPACKLAIDMLQHGGNAACHGALAAPMVLRLRKRAACHAVNVLVAGPSRGGGPSVSAVCAEHNWVVTCFVVPGVGGKGDEKRVIWAVHSAGHHESQYF